MNLDYTPSREDQAKLAGTRATEGFPVLIKLAEVEVEKFIIRLLNTPVEDEKAVIANHMRAKTASQLLEGFIARVNQEISACEEVLRQPTKPIDVTEGLLDLGEISTQEMLEDIQF